MLMLDVRNAIARILDRYVLADVVDITLRKMRRDKVPIPFMVEKLLQPAGAAGCLPEEGHPIGSFLSDLEEFTEPPAADGALGGEDRARLAPQASAGKRRRVSAPDAPTDSRCGGRGKLRSIQAMNAKTLLLTLAAGFGGLLPLTAAVQHQTVE